MSAPASKSGTTKTFGNYAVDTSLDIGRADLRLSSPTGEFTTIAALASQPDFRNWVGGVRIGGAGRGQRIIGYMSRIHLYGD